MAEKLFWEYGFECDGNPVEVEVVDLGAEGNAWVKRVYQQPVNMAEITEGMANV